jgi:hypothetical protein
MYADWPGSGSSLFPGGGKDWRRLLRVGGVGIGGCAAESDEGDDEYSYGKEASHGSIRSIRWTKNITHSIADIAFCHIAVTRVPYCHATFERARLLAIVREMTEDESQQLEMWWARLSSTQRAECRSLDLSNPVPTGHVLWSQPLLDVSAGLVARPPGVHVDPCVMEFLDQKRQVTDA